MKITLDQRILTSENMTSICQIILSDVWSKYSVIFAKEYRPFICIEESQENWINSVNVTFFDEILIERNRLFYLIPERFNKSIIFKDLKRKLDLLE